MLAVNFHGSICYGTIHIDGYPFGRRWIYSRNRQWIRGPFGAMAIRIWFGIRAIGFIQFGKQRITR